MSEIKVYYYIDNKSDIKRYVKLTGPNLTLGNVKNVLEKKLPQNRIFSYEFEDENGERETIFEDYKQIPIVNGKATCWLEEIKPLEAQAPGDLVPVVPNAPANERLLLCTNRIWRRCWNWYTSRSCWNCLGIERNSRAFCVMTVVGLVLTLLSLVFTVVGVVYAIRSHDLAQNSTKT